MVAACAVGCKPLTNSTIADGCKESAVHDSRAASPSIHLKGVKERKIFSQNRNRPTRQTAKPTRIADSLRGKSREVPLPRSHRPWRHSIPAGETTVLPQWNPAVRKRYVARIGICRVEQRITICPIGVPAVRDAGERLRCEDPRGAGGRVDHEMKVVAGSHSTSKYSLMYSERSRSTVSTRSVASCLLFSVACTRRTFSSSFRSCCA